MKNELERILSDSRHSVEDLVQVARAIHKVDSISRDSLPQREIPVLVRVSAAVTVIQCLADGIEPDLSYLSAALGIPRPTLHRWAKKIEEEGYIRLERRGRRKVVVIVELHPGMVKVLDAAVDYYKYLQAS